MIVTQRIRLGPHETRLLLELEARGSDLFTIGDAREILGRYDIAPVLHRLRSKGRVVEVKKGRYLLVPARAGPEGGWSESIYRLVDAVVGGNYYVGFWSAMNYWGMTEQIPRIVHVVSARRQRPFQFQDQRVRFVTLRPERIFGAAIEPLAKGTFRISDRERTLVDGLLVPRHCGGIVEVAKAFAMARYDVTWGRVHSYARRLGVDAVMRRLGYLEETLRMDARLPRKAFSGFQWLDPSAHHAILGISKEWGLYLNVPRGDLLASRRA
jgi:predicted transcriptional regulator of viral defense system